MWNLISVNFWNSVRHGSVGRTNGLNLWSCTFTMNNITHNACSTDPYFSLLCQLVWGGHWCCNKLIAYSFWSLQLNTHAKMMLWEVANNFFPPLKACQHQRRQLIVHGTLHGVGNIYKPKLNKVFLSKSNVCALHGNECGIYKYN